MGGRTNRQEIVVDLVKDGHGPAPVDLGGVREAGPVVEVARVDEQQVDAHVAGRLLHAPAERHKVAPVGAVVLLLQVALQPAMRIGLGGGCFSALLDLGLPHTHTTMSCPALAVLEGKGLTV